MIHIVFQYNDKEVLKEAMTLDESLQGEIIQIEDDFAVGPILNIYSVEGKETRKQWWREILDGGDYHGLVDNPSQTDDNDTISSIIDRLRKDSTQTLWIWAAQNKHDVSGYYWLISQLKEFQGRVLILYLNNLPFINSKGNIFYPVNLFEIPAKEFLKAKKLARLVTGSEFEVDSDEWLRLCNEHKGVRILEGGKKIQQYEYSFYDAELKKLITGEWQKGARLIHQFLSKAKETTGDAYLLWRLKQMVLSGEIDIQGTLKKMKDFEVKGRDIHPVPEIAQ
jgi:hypothetical protein